MVSLFFLISKLAHIYWENIRNTEICKKKKRDFPGGPVVKNLPYNAGGTGSIPGQGTKIPHAAGQLSPCATTTELVHLN